MTVQELVERDLKKARINLEQAKARANTPLPEVEHLEELCRLRARIVGLTEENEKLGAMVNMWRSTAYCEMDRNNSIKADTIHKMKRDLNVEFLYFARCQHDGEPNMTSQEVFDALDRVAERHLDVSGDDRFTQCEKKVKEMWEKQNEYEK